MSRFFTASLLIAASPTALMAYTDPGTGMLVWQSLMAISIGFIFSTRRLISRVFSKRDQ